MEEILAALLELFLEVIFQFIAEIPFDFALNRREKRGQTLGFRPRPGIWIAFSLLTGAAIGWLSGRLWPTPWPHAAFSHVTFVSVSPLLAGALSYFINRWRFRRGQDWRRPWFHAGCAVLFAMALAVTRFLVLS